MKLDAPVLTRREALERARDRLTAVVAYCIDAGLQLDQMDKDSIREALDMVTLALRDKPQTRPDWHPSSDNAMGVA